MSNHNAIWSTANDTWIWHSTTINTFTSLTWIMFRITANAVLPSQVFRIVLRVAVWDRRRSAERGRRIVGGRHIHHRADAGVLVRVEPPLEQGAESRLTRVRVHADRRQHCENACDRRPTVPGVHRGPHEVGTDRRCHGACQPLRREYNNYLPLTIHNLFGNYQYWCLYIII